MNKTSACIICSKENVQGIPVIEDKIIEVLRTIKSKLGIVKGYKLIVCKDCEKEYEKRRKTFERNLLLYGGLGVVIMIFLMFLNFSIGSFLSGLLLFFVLIILALLKYVPKIEKQKEVKENGSEKGTRRKKK